jgi:hypothetical protein
MACRTLVLLALVLTAGAQEPPRPRCDFLSPGLTARPLPPASHKSHRLIYGFRAQP